MYDEFGNLKKKFRAKAQQTEAAQSLPGVGRAGWDVEELGIMLYFDNFPVWMEQLSSFCCGCGDILWSVIMFSVEHCYCSLIW